ncbi:MAG: glycosyltransferase [Cytophagales bacterium]|nr:MAG: glycosyltransferase [Cytophagales bacterium]
MGFSILITYRNREPENIAILLQSIAQQTYANFEVLFLEAGSDPEKEETIQNITQKYPFVSYFQHWGRGHFWNKSLYLNFLLSKTTQPYILTLDADLCLPPFFLEKLHQILQSQPNQCIHIPVWYASPYFKNFERLSAFLQKGKLQGIKSNNKTALGCIAFASEALKNGTIEYNEWFRIWGAEDIDFLEQLKKKGLEVLHLDGTEIPVWHQWHEKVAEKLPHGWQYLIRHQPEKKKNNQKMILENADQRPALQIAEGSPHQYTLYDHTFSFPKEKSLMAMIEKFTTLQPNEALRILQLFDEIAPTAKESRWAKMARWANGKLQKWKISYRITDIKTHETTFMSVDEAHDWIFYFVLQFEEQIKDYYLKKDKNSLHFIVLKKPATPHTSGQ